MSDFACLTYHVLGRGKSQYTVPETQLRDHLAIMKSENYVVEGFEQLEHRFRLGIPFPQRYTVLTVDDGHESSIRVANILSEYNAKATFFVTRDRCLKKPGYVRESHLRELRQSGFSIGAHGTTHRRLTALPEARCVEELRDSKSWLEDVLGESIGYMAFPGGFVNARILQLADLQGYILTGTCNEWMNSPARMTLPSSVNRVNVRQHFSKATFRRILQGSPGFYLWRQVRSAALALPKEFLRD